MKNYLRKLRCISALLPLSVLSLQTVSAQTLPVPDHIVLIIFENHGRTSVMNASRAPHIMAWAADTNCAVFNSFYGITHPSQPNYLYLYSGTNQGETDNDIPAGIPFTSPNLGAGLIAVGKTFATYSEGMPSVGYNDGSYTVGTDYKRKHNPVTNWMGTGTNQVPVTCNQPWTAFPSPANYSTLPTVSFVVPDQNNDMHNGNYFTTITVGDTWMYNNLDAYRQWTLANNSLLIVTFDEDEGLEANKIATLFYGPMVKGGTYNNKETLVNLLGTIESMYGTTRAGAPFSGAINDTPITYCWKNTIADTTEDTTGTTGVNNLVSAPVFKVAPNPASDVINFYCSKPLNTNVVINVVDVNGRAAGNYTMNNTVFSVNTSSYPSGMYYYKIYNGQQVCDEGKFIVNH